MTDQALSSPTVRKADRAQGVAIESVERGFVVASVKDWWNGGDSKVVRDKMMDLAEAGGAVG